VNKGGARFQPNQKLSHQSCKTLWHIFSWTQHLGHDYASISHLLLVSHGPMTMMPNNSDQSFINLPHVVIDFDEDFSFSQFRL